MLIDRFNLNQFRVFECVYRHQNMTRAARELHITQSGVSQHVINLESIFERKLFDRIQNRLVPTEFAGRIYEICQGSLGRLENGLGRILEIQDTVSGTVRVGAPMEFANSRVIPALCKIGRDHPGISFEVKIDFAATIEKHVLDGSLDIGFIDGIEVHPGISTTPAFSEVLELCISPKHFPKACKPGVAFEELIALPGVTYDRNVGLLAFWFRHHFPRKRPPNFDFRAVVTNSQSVAAFVSHGLGMGVLPSYLVDRVRAQGTPLYCFKGPGKPCINRMSIIGLKGRSESKATELVRTELMAAL